MVPQATIDIDSSRPVILMHRVSPSQAHAVDGLAKGNPLVEAMHLIGATMSFPSGTEIFGEGEEADYAYQVVQWRRADLEDT